MKVTRPRRKRKTKEERLAKLRREALRIRKALDRQLHVSPALLRKTFMSTAKDRRALRPKAAKRGRK